LTGAEARLVRRHPAWGAEALIGVPGLAAVAMLVLCHHERWDGSGYPHGLSGERIRSAQRVLAGCDAWWAMTTHRAFAGALGEDAAIDELVAASGRQLDGRVVQALLAEVAGRDARRPERPHGPRRDRSGARRGRRRRRRHHRGHRPRGRARPGDGHPEGAGRRVRLAVAEEVFRRLDPGVRIERLAPEGVWHEPPTPVLRVEGSARALLTGERTALNFLQRLSGVATAAARAARAVEGTGAIVLDTRKTTRACGRWRSRRSPRAARPTTARGSTTWS